MPKKSHTQIKGWNELGMGIFIFYFLFFLNLQCTLMWACVGE